MRWSQAGWARKALCAHVSSGLFPDFKIQKKKTKPNF